MLTFARMARHAATILLQVAMFLKIVLLGLGGVAPTISIRTRKELPVAVESRNEWSRKRAARRTRWKGKVFQDAS